MLCNTLVKFIILYIFLLFFILLLCLHFVNKAHQNTSQLLFSISIHSSGVQGWWSEDVSRRCRPNKAADYDGRPEAGRVCSLLTNRSTAPQHEHAPAALLDWLSIRQLVGYHPSGSGISPLSSRLSAFHPFGVDK